jgi:acyl-CoA thioesterase-1
LALLCLLAMVPWFDVAEAAGRTRRIIALGDSLTAGYLLPAQAAFPTVLERALKADGLDVEVVNAGVSGDTATNGLDRLDWAVGEGADIVIVELGANDMLRGLDPEVTYRALTQIVTRLKARGVNVLLAGMMATPGLGKPYVEKFNAIYPRIAAEQKTPLYPFFLAGVIDDPRFLQADGMHPTAAGVEIMVKSILPMVSAQIEGSGAVR